MIIAEEMGVLASSDCHFFINLTRQAGLPLHHPLMTEALCNEAMKEAVKHRGGTLNFPIPAALGKCQFIKDPAEIKAVLVKSLDRLHQLVS